MGMSFLLEGERAYCGASSLFEKLKRLGVDPTLYELPPHYIFRPKELHYYVDSVLNDLRGKPQDDDHLYIVRICESLKEWAEKEYIVHVID